LCVCFFVFFFSSRRRHTRCALVTGVQTCALPIYGQVRARPWTGPCAEIVLRARHRHVGGRLGHRRVAHDGPGHLDGTERRHGNGDEATHAVADDDGRTVDARVVCNGEHLTGPLLELVALTVTAVTVATQVDCNDATPAGESRRSEEHPSELQ